MHQRTIVIVKRRAEQLRARLKLNLKAFLPRMSAAHRDAIHGPIPPTDDEAGLQRFSALMKLEPFQRGMKELAPRVWITALRKVQNPHRAGLDIVSLDPNFGTLKVSPVFNLNDEEMEAYLADHNLPNEWDYFDPAKADDDIESPTSAPTTITPLIFIFSTFTRVGL